MLKVELLEDGMGIQSILLIGQVMQLVTIKQIKLVELYLKNFGLKKVLVGVIYLRVIIMDLDLIKVMGHLIVSDIQYL